VPGGTPYRPWDVTKILGLLVAFYAVLYLGKWLGWWGG
jgi:hypothetical protein